MVFSTKEMRFLYLCCSPNLWKPRKPWRRLGTRAMVEEDFSGENAYDVLGVAENCSLEEIKSSFRKLAKETHPDARIRADAASTDCFIRIMAAYEILSDTQRRTHYDIYLSSQRRTLQRQWESSSAMYPGDHFAPHTKQMEVVQWLKWYRHVVNDIVSKKEIVMGSSYLERLEGELYEAIRAAYFGPVIDHMDLLPDCFEAEERSAIETAEILHLVSGRDLFGVIYIANKVLSLSEGSLKTLPSYVTMGPTFCASNGDRKMHLNLDMSYKTSNVAGQLLDSEESIRRMQSYGRYHKVHDSDVYKDLELHIAGKLVAVATRIPPRRHQNGLHYEDSQDHIHVFLNSTEDYEDCTARYVPKPSSGCSNLLGTISGLGTTPQESSCFVYDANGTKTHVIMKHRTMMVKHMHWYLVGDDVAACECRCSRAWLPSSKFWLFEPRCGMHDIGGWYIETFGRDKKGKTVPSKRKWDGSKADSKVDLTERSVEGKVPRRPAIFVHSNKLTGTHMHRSTSTLLVLVKDLYRFIQLSLH
ncbi:uncharacterized protein LOC18431816 isoform X2 [Amborella trichopoda]|uniref:uncharacterized protein LOC18431816 isoform X2 n=2 Tax=Amborella trichopoda TaxID=13333 RepID=UPI0009C0E6E0|nr:uncharacterized protein LOC18431816 isoform X2 [Amborella trichopoda]|eukprot:XP_020521387.1 uncharacterized protein LOC18431816 isoform X2 [Amborella trichopoda]